MTPDQLQQIIDALNSGGKYAFGLAVRQARIDAISITLGLVLCGAVAFAWSRWFRWARRADKANPDSVDERTMWASVVGIFVGVCLLAVLGTAATVIPTALFNPEYYALKGLLP